MKPDPYHDFADRYDLFFKQFDHFYPHYVAFFRRVFTRNKVRKILDCASGTGRHLYLFHTLGFEVSGSDISPAMIDQARKNLARFNLEVPMIQADFRKLSARFQETFDAVVCLSTSFPHVGNRNDAIRAITGAYEVLNPNGILVLTQSITDKMANERPRYFPVVIDRDFCRIFVMEYLKRKVRVDVLDLHHDGRSRDFLVSTFDYLLLLRDDYEEMLSAAGFEESRFYGGYKFEPYNKTSSERLIVVARKTKPA